MLTKVTRGRLHFPVQKAGNSKVKIHLSIPQARVLISASTGKVRCEPRSLSRVAEQNPPQVRVG